MSETNPSTIKLNETYLWLNDNSQAIAINNDKEFWPELAMGKRERHRYLVTQCTLTADFPHWEMHPLGDAVVTVVNGSATLIWKKTDVIQEQRLVSQDTVVIPAGIWHRLLVPKEVTLLVITAGEGTQQQSIDG